MITSIAAQQDELRADLIRFMEERATSMRQISFEIGITQITLLAFLENKTKMTYKTQFLIKRYLDRHRKEINFLLDNVSDID